jgi:hypothetical protein
LDYPGQALRKQNIPMFNRPRLTTAMRLSIVKKWWERPSLKFKAKSFSIYFKMKSLNGKEVIAMKKGISGKMFLRLGFFTFLVGGFFLAGLNGEAQEAQKKLDNKKAYKLYNQKCSGCHVSVADPERAGKTRDDWNLVIDVMHKNGVKLKMAESEMLIDYLYNLRKGIEKEAG